MGVTNALRTSIAGVLALGGIGCNYEYDRFKIDAPGTAGSIGTSSLNGGGGGTTPWSPATKGGTGAAGSELVGGTSSSAGETQRAGAPTASGGASTKTTIAVSPGGHTGTTTGGSTTGRPGTGGVASGGSVITGGTATGGLPLSLGGTTGGGAAPSSAGGAIASGGAGTTSRCQLPLVDCSGSCVDLTDNPAHCGACGHACYQASASWSVCVQRLCSCDGGNTRCSAGATCEKKDVCVGSAK